MGTLVLAVDTSGSITQEDLDAFAAELTSVVQSVRPETLYIVLCDADIQEILTPNPEDPLEIPFKGGGGTSFEPVFAWASQIEPDVLIYLTDLDGCFPRERPRYPVLWALFDPTHLDHFPPPFGEIILL